MTASRLIQQRLSDGTRRVILMLHSDCGAYGGLSSFDNDPAAERLHHRTEFERATAFLTEAVPGVQVECYFVDFEGVWAVERASAAV